MTPAALQSRIRCLSLYEWPNSLDTGILEELELMMEEVAVEPDRCLLNSDHGNSNGSYRRVKRRVGQAISDSLRAETRFSINICAARDQRGTAFFSGNAELDLNYGPDLKDRSFMLAVYSDLISGCELSRVAEKCFDILGSCYGAEFDLPINSGPGYYLVGLNAKTIGSDNRFQIKSNLLDPKRLENWNSSYLRGGLWDNGLFRDIYHINYCSNKHIENIRSSTVKGRCQDDKLFHIKFTKKAGIFSVLVEESNAHIGRLILGDFVIS